MITAGSHPSLPLLSLFRDSLSKASGTGNIATPPKRRCTKKDD